jgi:hypothetical protein
MQASTRIRDAVARVAVLRQKASNTPPLAQALLDIKRLQAQRFACTYQDLLASAVYAPSARFFLEELYGARDFTQRDQQFGRVAGALERTLPEKALNTVLALADLHGLSEQLDMRMAQQWLVADSARPGARYLQSWRRVGCAAERQWQLDTVLGIGKTLSELTRSRSLRVMLGLMRKPAQLAGLDALQLFLETGFDRFAGMVRQGGVIQEFLDTIAQRETLWISQLFAADAADAEATMDHAFNLIGTQTIANATNLSACK